MTKVPLFKKKVWDQTHSVNLIFVSHTYCTLRDCTPKVTCQTQLCRSQCIMKQMHNEAALSSCRSHDILHRVDSIPAFLRRFRFQWPQTNYICWHLYLKVWHKTKYDHWGKRHWLWQSQNTLQTPLDEEGWNTCAQHWFEVNNCSGLGDDANYLLWKVQGETCCGCSMMAQFQLQIVT